jgi:non-lysosomal glucosylceramidase
MECGSYYIRALSSYALVNAYSGFSFDQRTGEIGLKPARPEDGVYFWSAGRGWGVIELKGGGLTIKVRGGELSVSQVRFPEHSWASATVDGQVVRRRDDLILLTEERTLKAGEKLVIALS